MRSSASPFITRPSSSITLVATNGGEIKHVGEEVGFVIEGEFELTVGDRSYRLKAGDSFFFRSNQPHSYRNPSSVAARVLWVNTPPTF